MASDKDLVFVLSSLDGRGMRYINGDDSTPYARPGSIYFAVDAYGPRVLQYVQVRGGAQPTAELASKPANTAVNNITAADSSTTSAGTSGLTANDHVGKLCYVLDNADTAGTAPEGEVSIVAANTATKITLEKDYPYSVALAVNDDLILISNWQAEDAADGDLAVDVLGVVLGKDGISDDNYGWVQREGYVVANYTSGALTAGDPIVAGAGELAAFGSDGQELWCGYILAGVSADQAADRVPVNLQLFTAAGTGTAP